MSLREIRFYVDFFPEESNRASSEKQVLVLLEALTLLNQIYLDDHPDTPLLYDMYRKGEIAYKLPSQMGGGERENCETFRDIPRIIENGGGDCDNIACWRAAELRHRGIAAKPFITHRKRPGGGTIYHVQVLWPDGSSEDPCLLIGMAPERVDEIANEKRKLQERIAEEVAGQLAKSSGDASTILGDRERRQAQLLEVMGWFLRANSQ